jgi:hypothetical protein
MAAGDGERRYARREPSLGSNGSKGMAPLLASGHGRASGGKRDKTRTMHFP